METLWSTVEPCDLVQKAYPDLVSSYLDAVGAKTKKSSKSSKSKKANPIISDNDKENDCSEKAKNTKKKAKARSDGKTRQIDEYFKKVKGLPTVTTPKSQHVQTKPPTQSPKIQTCSTPLALTQLSFDFDNTTDEVLDLSDIIRGIISHSPTVTNICGKKLHYDRANEPTELQTPSIKAVEVDAKDTRNETADEFDLIVAGIKSLPSKVATPPNPSRKEAKKRPVDKTTAAKNVKNIDSPTTTPIIIKKFFRRHGIHPKTSSTPTISPESQPQSPNESFESIPSPTKVDNVNVSYFFGDITEENDVFEKLTDFRNMEDEDCADDAGDVPSGDDELHDIEESPEIVLSDTFDLDDYVPVGANLRKRIASWMLHFK